jgi:SAM-dependent methyltransferase
MDTERWSAAVWPFVRSRLPSPPASVLELGCGSAGGFVRALRESGYDAAGIDPNAPAASGFHRIGFEQFEPEQPVDAVVASRSLHHVADIGEMVRHIAAVLRPGGTLVVAEWAWEQFDADTAEWCFSRADGSREAAEPGWLMRRRDGWRVSGRPWDAYFADWATGHELVRAERILAEFDVHFEPVVCTYGPYFFADLAGVSDGDEQAAIDRGEIRATGIRYAGTPRPRA